MSEGSHMVGGRTYRNILTTNDQKPTGPVESQKLGVITTAIIPNAVPQPEPKGTDLSKMITTHDEPKAKMPVLKMIEHPVFQGPLPESLTETNGGDKYVDIPAKKKSGRPKKGE